MAESSNPESNESGLSKENERVSIKRGAIPSPKSAIDAAIPYVPDDDEDSSPKPDTAKE